MKNIIHVLLLVLGVSLLHSCSKETNSRSGGSEESSRPENPYLGEFTFGEDTSSYETLLTDSCNCACRMRVVCMRIIPWRYQGIGPIEWFVEFTFRYRSGTVVYGYTQTFSGFGHSVGAWYALQKPVIKDDCLAESKDNYIVSEFYAPSALQSINYEMYVELQCGDTSSAITRFRLEGSQGWHVPTSVFADPENVLGVAPFKLSEECVARGHGGNTYMPGTPVDYPCTHHTGPGPGL